MDRLDAGAQTRREGGTMRPKTRWIAAAVGMSVCTVLLAGRSESQTNGRFELVPKIVLASTRDRPDDANRLLSTEIYMMNPDGTSPERLTNNYVADLFPALSPDGKKLVFESNLYNLDVPCRPNGPAITDDLFVMDSDGTSQRLLTRGSSASWSPDSKYIAFHASASYYASGGSTTGAPIKCDAGAATTDSDIFVANLDDLLSETAVPDNLTNTAQAIEDDPDWSPDGTRIAFTSHPVTDNPENSIHAEINVLNLDGAGRHQLTSNDYEERAPAWSPDGSRIAFMCRVGPINVNTGFRSFEICLMNADGTGQVRLTNNGVLDATPSWSPDGQKIVLHRNPPPLQLWLIDLADLTCDPDAGATIPCTCNNPALNNSTYSCATPLTFRPGENAFPKWGMLRVRSR